MWLWRKGQKKILLYVHSFPLTPPQASYPTQPAPSAHHPHLLWFRLLVTGTPLPEFSDPLDLSVCIIPALPLSRPCCTRSVCFYCCHSPTYICSQALCHTKSPTLSSPLPQYLFLCTQDGHPWGLRFCVCLCSDHRQTEKDMTVINLWLLKWAAPTRQQLQREVVVMSSLSPFWKAPPRRHTEPWAICRGHAAGRRRGLLPGQSFC